MTRKTEASENPSRAAVVGAVIFWAVAAGLSWLTIAIVDVPGWLWGFRGIMALAGALIVFGLLRRESYRRHHGLAKPRQPTVIDIWTIVHTTAGLVMGAWGIPLPLVALFTIGWEIYEYYVPGFGDTELTINSVGDVVVAWIGWFVVAGLLALITHTTLPWLLPSAQSLVRNAGLHLF